MRLIIALCLSVACLGASAQTYRWVDGNGRTVVSDTPPPANARDVAKDASKAQADDGMSYATRLANQKFPVTLYTSTDCGEPCRQGRDLLNGRGIPFTEKSVQKEADLAELKQIVGDNFVPALRVGRQSARGFDATSWHNLLDTAGYPKSGGSKR